MHTEAHTEDNVDEEVLEELAHQIEARLLDDVRWHLGHGSTGTRDQLVALAARREEQRLHELAKKYDQEGERALADFIRLLKQDWLQERVARFRSRL